MTRRRTLVFGIGNRLRGDDGAGHAVVEQLRVHTRSGAVETAVVKTLRVVAAG